MLNKCVYGVAYAYDTVYSTYIHTPTEKEMSISVIRKVTSKDLERVSASAARFCKRHEITVIDGDAESAIAYNTYYQEQTTYLHTLWIGCLARALNEKRDVRLCIAYGHVGLSA